MVFGGCVMGTLSLIYSKTFLNFKKQTQISIPLPKHDENSETIETVHIFDQGDQNFQIHVWHPKETLLMLLLLIYTF